MNELFTADVVYDLRDFGRGELRGIEAVARADSTLRATLPRQSYNETSLKEK